MRDKATFHIADDWVALLDLKPAGRTIYSLLRCNAEYDRNVAKHTVHVTASWFVEMTQHWEKPLHPATVRRGINELIDKGVVIRLNDPHDGSGYSLAFVADPGKKYDGPVNGFQQAKRVAKRCGTKAYYLRNEDNRPGTPAVTGVRLHPSKRWDSRPVEQPEPEVPDEPNILDEIEEEVDGGDAQARPAEPEFDAPAKPERPQGSGRKQPVPPEISELARLLESKCEGKGLNRRGLLEGEALRVAEACADALAQGWTPERISTKLSALVSNGIHTPQSFLLKKVPDLGTPPETPRTDGTVLVDGKPVDLGSIPWSVQPEMNTKAKADQPSLPPSTDDESKRARLAQLARQQRRRL